MTTVFVVGAVVGFGLLILGLLFDGVLEGVFDALDVGGGLTSVPVIGAFLAAFGVGGYVVAEGLGAPLAVAVLGAVGVGVVFAFVAFRLSAAFINMPTDPTLTAGSYQGQIGRVVTPVVAGRGEILLRVGGSHHKLSAHAEADIARGAEVVVIEVLSSTSVRVMEVSELLEE